MGRERRQCVHGGRAWSDLYKLTNAGSHQKPEKARDDSSLKSLEGAWPGGCLSDAWTTGLQHCEKRFLLLYAATLVAICYTSHRQTSTDVATREWGGAVTNP